MNSGKVFLGILAGLAAGTVLGLLFGPEKGSNAIKKIGENEDDFIDELNEKFDHFLEVMNKKIDHLAKDISIVAKND